MVWRRGCGRGHGGGLTDPAGVIRPAVEAALEVARQGLALDPPRDPPAGLRRYLTFAKLSPPALRAIAKLVEADDAFRGIVAGEVDEATVGRAGWLWLDRPSGWEDEVAALEAEARVAADDAAEAREERRARRKLVAVQEAVDRATADVQRLSRELEQTRSELTQERARRAGAEERTRGTEDQARRIEAELDRVRAERDRAVRDREDAEGRLAAQAADLERANAQLREQRDVQDASEAGERTDEHRPRPSDPAAMARAVRDAADGARALGDALESLGSLLQPAPGTPSATDGPAEGQGPSAGEQEDAEDTEGTASDPGGAGRRRTPLRLPGGVLDDSAEAARHLLRAPKVVVLVDGYNVSMAGWPDRPVDEQRARLVRAVDGLAARSGADIEVVFDGAEVDAPGPASRSRDVRVRFSPPAVEADEVLLDLVARIPPARPVVVVSSDKRVRKGARREGANVIHARQLLEAAGP